MTGPGVIWELLYVLFCNHGGRTFPAAVFKPPHQEPCVVIVGHAMYALTRNTLQHALPPHSFIPNTSMSE